MFTDPIADMLTRIRNGYAVKKETVSLPYSKFKYGIAQVLVKEGFVAEVERKGRGTARSLNIRLSYFDGEPAVTNFMRISKPGQRVYTSYRDIGRARRGFGVTILSTPKGLLTDKEARKNKLGGEVLCEIW